MEHPSQTRSTWLVIAPWSAFVLLWLAAGWPGWVDEDSLEMFDQARGLAPFNDWHSPLLSFAWSWLAPHTLGPAGPFLVQTACLWSGLLLVALWIHGKGVRWAWLLFVSALVVRASWVGAWVIKDATALVLVSLALGLAVTASNRPRGLAARLLLVVIPCLLAAVASVRWYLSPALALGTLVPVALTSAADSTRTLVRAGAKSLLIFAVVLAGLLSFQAFVIRPRPSYVATISFMLDIARVECAVGTPADRAAGRSLFPSVVLISIPGDDICTRFNPWIHDPLLYVHDEDRESRDRIPSDAQELAQVESAWWRVIRAHPAIVAAGKARLFLKMLLQPDAAYFPGPTSSINRRLAAWAAPGRGGDHGWPSQGGLARAVAVAPALLIDTASGLWIAVLPLATLLWIRRRHPDLMRTVAPLLLWPVCWLANFAAVAPASEARYAAPAALWGFLSVVITAGLLKARTAGAARQTS